MENCIFCKLVAKEIPAHVVYEDDETLSFLDVTPSSPGHVMVILKKHGKSILDYNEKELGKIMVTVQHMAKKVEKALKTDSITIGINHLERRGVPHLHIHLIPRWEEDKGHAIQGVVKKEGKEDLARIAEKIKNVSSSLEE